MLYKITCKILLFYALYFPCVTLPDLRHIHLTNSFWGLTNAGKYQTMDLSHNGFCSNHMLACLTMFTKLPAIPTFPLRLPLTTSACIYHLFTSIPLVRHRCQPTIHLPAVFREKSCSARILRKSPDRLCPARILCKSAGILCPESTGRFRPISANSRLQHYKAQQAGESRLALQKVQQAGGRELAGLTKRSR